MIFNGKAGISRGITKLESALESLIGQSNGHSLFTAAELEDLQAAASESAFAYLSGRFARDGKPAFEGVDDESDPLIQYMDACLEALGVPLMPCSWREGYKPFPIDLERIVEALPYLESFLHVAGNAGWQSRQAWRVLLREHQIPVEPEAWEWYRECKPVPMGWKPLRVGD